MKATKQYVPVLLLITLGKVVLAFVCIEIKTIEHCFPVVLFIVLHKVVLPIGSWFCLWMKS